MLQVFHTLHHAEKIPLYSKFTEVFFFLNHNHEWVLDFDDHVIYLFLVDIFLNAKPALHVWDKFHLVMLCIFFFFFFFLATSWAIPAACGSSQARGRTGAVATRPRQSHSNEGSEPRLQPTPQLTATPDR